MIIKSLEPQYGKNYGLGYSGFEFHSNSVVSQGIAYFERWDRMSDFRVSHAFTVTGPDSCIEALAGPDEVQENNLHDRFADPHAHIFFRKPRGITIDSGIRIVKTLRPHLGEKYDHSLAVGHVVPNLWIVRRILPKSTLETAEEWFLEKCDSINEWICSELNALGLDSQPEWHDKGCLVHANFCIRPQTLFEDDAIYEGWKGQTA
jgi:hypothetical protein